MSDLPPSRPRKTPKKSVRRAYFRGYYQRNKARRNAQVRAYKNRHPGLTRDYNLRSRYGITLAQYNEMFEAQGRRCASCEDANPISWRGNQWCVDHNHTTGKVRAIICNPCNTTMGQHRDCPERLMKVALYAERHQ